VWSGRSVDASCLRPPNNTEITIEQEADAVMIGFRGCACQVALAVIELSLMGRQRLWPSPDVAQGTITDRPVGRMLAQPLFGVNQQFPSGLIGNLSGPAEATIIAGDPFSIAR
jgi:hypothetical protein